MFAKYFFTEIKNEIMGSIKKELFKNLAIYDKPYDWKAYPVMHLDLANCDIETPEDLSKYLSTE